MTADHTENINEPIPDVQTLIAVRRALAIVHGSDPIPFIKQLQTKAQIMHDLHDALGVEWGEDPRLVIKKLQTDASMYSVCQKALDEIAEIIAPGRTLRYMAEIIDIVRERFPGSEPIGANTHDNTENCWCGPTVETYEDGSREIYHNR